MSSARHGFMFSKSFLLLTFLAVPFPAPFVAVAAAKPALSLSNGSTAHLKFLFSAAA